jgi:sigma-B regulation protein RsbU (phosphoserine phosphatase)
MHGRHLYPLVFVVDDDPSIVHTIGRLLQRAGFRTSSAANVSDALRGIYEQSPDLILLDVHLPDGSGFEICRKITNQGATFATPILFISASEDTSTKIEGFEVGGVDYITKPIVGAELVARVRTHLRLKRAYELLAELQSERVQRLASAQMELMPRPEDFPEARFQVSIRQVLTAGGDFYDVIPSGDGVVDYIVADASGHDLGASLWTASLKALATEYAGPLNSPLEIVCALNNSLCRILPPGAFFTLVYARLNHHTGRLTLVNAGHPPVIVLHISGETPSILRQTGDVVGAFTDAVFGISELTLLPGDRALFYTDGMIETGGPYEQGLARLAASCLLRRSLPLAEMVQDVVKDITAGHNPKDDMLLLGVEK